MTNTQEVWDKLLDPDAYCIAQLRRQFESHRRSIRLPDRTNLTGQCYAALRRMGFNAVFDTNFGATSRSWKRPPSS